MKRDKKIFILDDTIRFNPRIIRGQGEEEMKFSWLQLVELIDRKKRIFLSCYILKELFRLFISFLSHIHCIILFMDNIIEIRIIHQLPRRMILGM